MASDELQTPIEELPRRIELGDPRLRGPFALVILMLSYFVLAGLQPHVFTFLRGLGDASFYGLAARLAWVVMALLVPLPALACLGALMPLYLYWALAVAAFSLASAMGFGIPMAFMLGLLPGAVLIRAMKSWNAPRVLATGQESGIHGAALPIHVVGWFLMFFWVIGGVYAQGIASRESFLREGALPGQRVEDFIATIPLAEGTFFCHADNGEDKPGINLIRGMGDYATVSEGEGHEAHFATEAEFNQAWPGYAKRLAGFHHFGFIFMGMSFAKLRFDVAAEQGRITSVKDSGNVD